MKKQILKGIVVFLIVWILQAFLNGLIPAGMMVPNVILCMTIALIHVYGDDIRWMAIGLIAALCMDMWNGLFVGIGMCALLAAEIVILILRHFIDYDNVLFSAGISTVTIFVYYTVYFVLAKAKGSFYSYGYAIKYILIELVMNVIIFMIIYLFLMKHERKVNKRNWYNR